MNSRDALIEWLQPYCKIQVRDGVLKVLQRLRQTRSGLHFVRSCNALLNFKDDEYENVVNNLGLKLDSLERLTDNVSRDGFSKFPKSSTQEHTNSTGIKTIVPSSKPSDLDESNKKFHCSNIANSDVLIPNISNQSDDDDLDSLLSNDSVTPKFTEVQKENRKPLFKRIGKEKAKLLNREFLANKSSAKEPSTFKIKNAENSDASGGDLEYTDHLSPKSSSVDLPEKFIVSDSDISSDDMEWYDEYLDNGILDDYKFNRQLNFKGSYFKPINEHEGEDRISLHTFPLRKRKDWLPKFLKDYATNFKLSEDDILGSFSDAQQNGIVGPFKRPDSEFSRKAKLGSQTVAFERLATCNQKLTKMKTEVEGTQLGSILGYNEAKYPKDITEHSNTETNIFSDSGESMNSIRKSLPVYQVKSDLVQLIRDNQVCIVIGETGSGKTTQLAQYLYEDGFCSNDRMIGCTQPRRVAAMSVARRVSQEMNTKLGEKVGYTIRFEDRTSPETAIKFMTDGILLREVQLDPYLEKYNCVIIDEAHERSLNTDILLGILKDLIRKRTDLRLIITSATLNASKFSNYFGSAPTFKIPGKTFPVTINYTSHTVDDYVKAAAVEAVKIHVSNAANTGDILIFMTGQEDIEVTIKLIKQKLLEIYMRKHKATTIDDINDMQIFPIYSALPSEVQNKVFRKTDASVRKIVVATNIAETSLTIDGIKYVIDCGYSKVKIFNPRLGLESLVIAPISLANANQRSGRAGRTRAGIAYRLYTEETAMDDMYQQALPEIQRSNLPNTILTLKSLGIKNLLDFDFIDQPPLRTMLASLYELWLLGAIDNFGNLTDLGKKMALLPLTPSLSKVLICSSQNGCSEEMLTIVSMLSVPQVFNRPKNFEQQSDTVRSRFFVPDSDHLTLLNVYSQWITGKCSKTWCDRNFLHYKSLLRARDIRKQLARVLVRVNIPIVSSGTKWDMLKRSICAGYAHQAAKATGLGKYSQLRTGLKTHIHPTSALHGLGNIPPYVVYHELLLTSKEYMCCVTAVDPLWLADTACLLYDIKKPIEHQEEFDKSGFNAEYPKNLQDVSKHDSTDVKILKVINKREMMIEEIKSIDREEKEVVHMRRKNSNIAADGTTVKKNFLKKKRRI